MRIVQSSRVPIFKFVYYTILEIVSFQVPLKTILLCCPLTVKNKFADKQTENISEGTNFQSCITYKLNFQLQH